MGAMVRHDPAIVGVGFGLSGARSARTKIQGEETMQQVDAAMEWTIMSECDIPRDMGSMLVPSEEPVAAFTTIRDRAVLTNRRLIIKDIEPITGKSTEVYSLPWKSVSSWAFVNSNKITEFSSTLRIWMSGELMAIRIRRGVDLNKIDAIIAQHVL